MTGLKRVSTPKRTDQLVNYLRDTARLDAHTPTALYQRLEGAFRDAIKEALIPPGAAIPGERDLAQRLNVSRVTVRKAIKALVDDRLLVQRPGARTSVADRVEKPVSQFASFSQDMLARGHAPGTIWLGRERAVALPAEAMALGLSPGAEVCRLHRLRTADGTPMAVEFSVVPGEFLPDAEFVATSLYAALEEQGHEPVRALQRMRATIAEPEEAKLLGLTRGAPILEIERRCFLATGRAVEYCRSRYRGDRYDFLVELQK
jgi:GntR family transcriptional regulator